MTEDYEDFQEENMRKLLKEDYEELRRGGKAIDEMRRRRFASCGYNLEEENKKERMNISDIVRLHLKEDDRVYYATMHHLHSIRDDALSNIGRNNACRFMREAKKMDKLKKEEAEARKKMNELKKRPPF